MLAINFTIKVFHSDEVEIGDIMEKYNVLLDRRVNYNESRTTLDCHCPSYKNFKQFLKEVDESSINVLLIM